MFSTFVEKNTRCVLCCRQIRGVLELGKIPVDACLDGLENLDAAFVWLSLYTFVGLLACINFGLEGRTHGRKWARVVQVSKTMKI